MPRAQQLLILAVLLVLPACATKPTVVTPKVVTQTVTKYVAVPAELTAACPIEQPKLRTVAEAVRVAAARRESLEQCNRQLDQIRSLGQ
ncbi:hypothetical protein FHW84_001817 [Dyella sp. SG562]|uniref:Rz1-like lysis system protein LysC n=1 Tax=Dyella sp. SG562 TaxID=2587017 RepID=UPI0014200D42|nr:hypothetical protein [Dyella sp. SG562]NII73248.1 hypothetical protein [Dyella sp. SG562]